MLGYIPDGQFSDFGLNIIPAMLQAGEKMYAVKMEDPIVGIDTFHAYQKAQALANEMKGTV